MVGFENDTDQLAQEFMEELWSIDSLAAAAELESKLSTVIRLTEEIIQLGRQAYLESMDQAMRRRRAILKRVADALVWRIFGSHRKYLRAYALGKSPGFMAGKAGYMSERLAVAKAQDFIPEPYRSRAQCVFAVQNDITNCLRFGDVTCLMDDDTIIPFEIKTGKSRGARSRRQDERHDAVTEYLATGLTSNPLVSEVPLKRIDGDIQDRHAWTFVETVAETITADNLCSSIVVDDCTLVIAADTIQQDVLVPAIGGTMSTLGWNPAEVRYGSLDRHIALRDDEVLTTLTPIMNWPISHEVIADIVLERVTVYVFINVSRLREVAAQAGIPVQPAQDSSPRALALSTTGQFHRLEIGERMWDQLLYELLTVPSFIDQLKRLSEGALELGSAGV